MLRFDRWLAAFLLALPLAVAAAEPLYPVVDRATAVLVHVNVGDKGISDNFDVAERDGIPLNKGVPALAVLESDGRLVYAQRSGEFESMRRMDPKSVNDFLEQWRKR